MPKGNLFADRHYQTPDPPAPYGLVCFRVYVPKHTLYIAAFWGAYRFFTSWLAWVRDPLHKGKVAAALWATAYTKARDEYILTGGRCEMNVTGVRQHPNDKCILQVEFDGNNVWVDVANFKDCSGCGGGGAMQFDGVNVTIYNDCTGDFDPSGEPYNPITSHIYDSLYSVDEEGRCNGAANIAAWAHYVSDESLSILATAGIAGAAISFIVGTLGSIAGAGFLTESLIAGMLAELVNSSEMLEAAAAIDITEELRDILYGYMDDDGTIREPNFTEALSALYARRDEETVDTAERVRWGHEVNILSALGPSVISRQNKYAGITDADCTGSGWSHVFDFTTGKQGFVEDELGAGALYVAGVGWRTVLFTDEFGNMYRTVKIKRALPTRTITQVKTYFTQTLGENHLEDTFEAVGAYLYVNETTVVMDRTEFPNGAQIASWSGTQTGVTLIVPGVVVGFWAEEPEADPNGVGTITKLVVSGTGLDPF